ncbi:putative protein 9 [Haloarcula hispanica icosahedral virus 2]|uniref:Uncharacterized protein n=1 Tax=Haloarcula hispanica icosahedral virus 2 TaxID=1154689 RepID=H9AZW5_9VIRU|nr:putative protein 9 [Haloarcula hispanica icosahedral virus 2]AFD02290.1 putative protein 9 [Haloarcula hispanica icosahedral virus 2]
MSNDLDALGGIDMNPRKMAATMRDPEGIAEMLQESGPNGDSPAEIFADIINVIRADTRRLGLALGVDVDAGHMTPQRAGQLLAGTVAGDGVELVVMFNELAERRDELLRDQLDDDEYEAFMAAKHEMMHTAEPGEFEEGDA